VKEITVEKIKRSKGDFDEALLGKTPLLPDSLDTLEVKLRDYNVIEIWIVPDDESCKSCITLDVRSWKDFMEKIKDIGAKVEKILFERRRVKED